MDKRKDGTEICPRRAGCLEKHGVNPAGRYRCGFEICSTVAGCPKVKGGAP